MHDAVPIEVQPHSQPNSIILLVMWVVVDVVVGEESRDAGDQLVVSSISALALVRLRELSAPSMSTASWDVRPGRRIPRTEGIVRCLPVLGT